MDKPFSQACENNKQPILEIIREVFADTDYVLEVGSGTGQHAVFFAQRMPHLQWQASDQAHYLPGIRAWRDDADLPNLPPPLELDVTRPWPVTDIPAVFSANTLHIMSWQAVEAFFAALGERLAETGHLCLYGPFNYRGGYTSESNARFDQSLRQRDPKSGIRDFEAIEALAGEQGLALAGDYTMPANNRVLHFTKVS